MFSSDEFVRVKADITWVMMNYSLLTEKERPFVRDLKEQMLAYDQFMHMTNKQRAWFSTIVERINNETSNGRLGDAGDEANLPHP